MLKRQRGVTLLEVLVSLLVLSIGLLGLASLQTNALRFNQGAFLRTQSTILAYDIIDRMRANRDEALNTVNYTLALGVTPPAAPNCVTGDCTPAQIAAYDIALWKAEVGSRLPEGDASITASGIGAGRIYTVTTEWKGRDVDTSLTNPTAFKKVTLAIRSEI